MFSVDDGDGNCVPSWRYRAEFAIIIFLAILVAEMVSPS